MTLLPILELHDSGHYLPDNDDYLDRPLWVYFETYCNCQSIGDLLVQFFPTI